MQRFGCLLLVALFSIDFASSQSSTRSEGWISLFDGKSLDGWKASDKEGTFNVQDGMIVVNGPRSHLYYIGPVEKHDFKNFDFKADVMTTPGSNSGIYFHTAYQAQGWPDKGFEVQVNNSHTDWKRTGGLYDVKDVSEAPAADNEWFTEHIIVQGKRIRTYVNDKLIVDYTEPANVTPPENHPGRVLSSGTFALQGHDPKSKVFYKNIMVRRVPD
jgi:3-keto-disaccharide hydrolase